jgi:hypothetical protein
MHKNINILRQQLGQVALNPIHVVDPALLQASVAPLVGVRGDAGKEFYSDGGPRPSGHCVL